MTEYILACVAVAAGKVWDDHKKVLLDSDLEMRLWGSQPAFLAYRSHVFLTEYRHRHCPMIGPKAGFDWYKTEDRRKE